MNGVSKQETTRLIEELVGTYDDFVLISMMIQKETSVLDYTQTKKKEFFHHLFQLDKYQEYHEIAKLKSKESVEFEVKQLDKKLKEHNLANYEQNIVKLVNQIQLLEGEYEIQQRQIELDEIRIRELRDGLNPIEEVTLTNGETWEIIDENIKKNKSEFEGGRNIPREDWYIDKLSQIKKLPETLQQLKQKKDTLRKKITNVLEYFQPLSDLCRDILPIIYEKITSVSGSVTAATPSNSIDSIIVEWREIYERVEQSFVRFAEMRERMEKECEEMSNDNMMDEWRRIQNDIEVKIEQKNKKEKRIREMANERERIIEKVEKGREMRDKLTKHRYNPQCEYCCENPFVKQAQNMIDEIPQLEERMNAIGVESDRMVREKDTIDREIGNLRKDKIRMDQEMNENKIEIQNIRKRIQSIRGVVEFLQEWCKAYEELAPTKENIRVSLKNQEIEKEIEEWKQRRSRYNDYVRNIELYNKYQQNKVLWKANNDIHQQIEVIEETLDVNKNEMKKKYEKLCKSRLELEKYETLRKQYNDDHRNYEEKKLEMEIYRLYLTCMEKNGIPLMLLKKSIPNMEQLMNDFLKGFVGFQMKIEIKDMDLEFRILRNHLSANEKKNKMLKGSSGNENGGDTGNVSDGRDYNILLLSGFERFITQVALRMAMHQLGMLPTCSIFFVDEGVNCFDRENLAKVSMLFEQILYRYETFIVITHLDQVKDSVQNFIEINDNGRFSSIRVM
jgi:DNA repair exonuclease SbcCD ATPase subunit